MNALVIGETAQREIDESYAWYEQQSPGLGDEFRSCLDDAFGLIASRPLLYPIAYRDIRKTVVRRFPFVVLYVVEGDTTVVLNVFHTSRNPSKWRRPK